jgi:hypothetical protein
MHQSKSNSSASVLLRLYFLLGVVEGLGALFLLLKTPSDPDSAWLLGYSMPRTASALLLLVIVAVWLRLAFLGQRNPAWREELTERLSQFVAGFRVALPIFALAIGFVFFGTYFYIYAQAGELPTLFGYLSRIHPFVLYALSRFGFALLIIVFLSFTVGEPPARAEHQNTIRVNSGKLTLIVTALVIFLVLAGVAVVLIRFTVGDKEIYGLEPLFNLNKENNVPTFFSSLLLAAASLLCAVIAAAKRGAKDRYAPHWMLLAATLLFLSLDEIAALHNWLGGPAAALLGIQRYWNYGWVLLALPFVLALLALFSRFFFDLPKTTKRLILIAVVVFFSGAMGVELLGGWYAFQTSESDLIYNLSVILEETLEMLGVVILIHALLRYLHEDISETRFLW